MNVKILEKNQYWMNLKYCLSFKLLLRCLRTPTGNYALIISSHKNKPDTFSNTQNPVINLNR